MYLQVHFSACQRHGAIPHFSSTHNLYHYFCDQGEKLACQGVSCPIYFLVHCTWRQCVYCTMDAGSKWIFILCQSLILCLCHWTVVFYAV